MGPTSNMNFPYFSPAGVPSGRGFVVLPNGLRGSHCGAAAVEVLSCGRDRVRWPVPLADLRIPRPAVEPAAFPTQLNAAGSLVLRRMDRRGLVSTQEWLIMHGPFVRPRRSKCQGDHISP